MTISKTRINLIIYTIKSMKMKIMNVMNSRMVNLFV